ncbi:MAG TPA: LytTR family DNA-binding domain-containing protein [Bacteroidia bacterium]|nr:LytTR family DNA-binding domain-containing protein [Bacteroidia bacterium]
MKTTAIIADDEKNGAESLGLLITEYCSGLEIKAIVHSVKDAITAIKKHKPSIVFLDIEMPVGNGFDIANETADQQYKIIFTTAHKDYAIEALKLQAIDYLLKPIDADELMTAVNNAVRQISSQVNFNQLNNLFQQAQSNRQTARISIPGNDGFILMDTDKIIRLEADSNYTQLYSSDGKKITVSKTLKEFETLLDASIFFRIHHTHIINLNKVERYVRGDGGYVILKDGSSVPVSRSRKIEFLNLIGSGQV